MYFYKLFILVALLSINVFAVSEVDAELERRFSAGGSMNSFKQDNKDKICRLYRSLDPEVKPLLLRAFDRDGHMAGSCENVTVWVYENVAKIQKMAIVQAFEMFDRGGCLHPVFESAKLNLLSCLVSIQREKLSVSFLNMLRKAIAEGALLAEVGKFSDIFFRTVKEGVSRAEIGKFVKSMKRLRRTKKGHKRSTPTLMDVMCDTIFARTTNPRQEFLRWFCLDNAVKERVIAVYNQENVIPSNVVIKVSKMFGKSGCLHTATADVKLNIIGLLVNMPEDQSIGFLNILKIAVQESTSQAEIRACIHSMRKFKDRRIIQYFCNLWNSWLKYKEMYPSSPLNQFFNVRQYAFTVTSLLDEGGVSMAPFDVMEIMYSVFSTNLDAPYVNEEFLKWLCLNNQAKKKVVSRLNFKGVFKKPFKLEHRAIIRNYLGLSEASPRDPVSKVLLMETKSVDDYKADMLECLVRERDTAREAFVAAEGPKMAAARAAERENKLRGELTVVPEPETRSPFMPLAVGDNPSFPSTEKKSNGVTDGYVSDSSQSICSVDCVDEEFDSFARPQTPAFGKSMGSGFSQSAGSVDDGFDLIARSSTPAFGQSRNVVVSA